MLYARAHKLQAATLTIYIRQTIFTHVHTLSHTHTHIHTHTHTHTLTHSHIHTHTRAHAHMHAHMPTHTHTHTHMCTHTHTQSHMCKQCGSIISPMLDKPPPTGSALSHIQPQWKCRMCENGGHIEIISVPYVFRYLTAELVAMNIRVKLETS